MNPIANFGINAIAQHMRSQKPSQGFAPLSQQALEKVESAIRESLRPNRDTMETGGERLETGTGTTFGKPIEELTGEEWGIRLRSKLFTQFTESHVSETAQKLSELMDEEGWISHKVSALGSGMTTAQLAEHFGGIGKQIDVAYAGGSISQQEYEDLNRGLEKYTEAVTSMAERGTAARVVIRKMAKAVRNLVKSGASEREIAAYAEKNQKTLQSQISQYIREHCAINRPLLADLIKQVRNGEPPPAEEDTKLADSQKDSVESLKYVSPALAARMDPVSEENPSVQASTHSPA